MNQPIDTALHHKLQRIEELVRKIDDIPDPAVRASVSDTIRTILDFHGAALARIVDRLAQPSSAALLDLAQDDLIASLLLLYDLHPLDQHARVQRALTKLEPELRQHSLSAALVPGPAALLRVRLTGTLQGCHSHLPALRQTIQDALYAAAPEADAVEIDDATTDAHAKQFVALTTSVPVDATR